MSVGCGASCLTGIAESKRQANQLFFQQMDAMRFLARTYNSSISGNSTSNTSGVVSMEEITDSGISETQRALDGTAAAAAAEASNIRLAQWVDSEGVENLLVFGRQNMRPARAFYSPVAGRIEQSKWQGDNPNNTGYGYYMTLRSAMDNSLFLFAHIDPDSLTVSVGDTVSQSQLLGQYANPKNGGATGPHLHFEWWADHIGGKRLNPRGYLDIVIPDYVITAPIMKRDNHPVHGGKRNHNGYDMVSH
jgi:hypothetical protein